jgi:hypothetical protein
MALPAKAAASYPRDVRKAAVSLATSALRSLTATCAPSRARKCAMVPPIFETGAEHDGDFSLEPIHWRLPFSVSVMRRGRDCISRF